MPAKEVDAATAARLISGRTGPMQVRRSSFSRIGPMEDACGS
jgi:hypothetical protein